MSPVRRRNCIHCGQRLFVDTVQWYGFCDEECERLFERRNDPQWEDDIEFAQSLGDGTAILTREDSDDN